MLPAIISAVKTPKVTVKSILEESSTEDINAAPAVATKGLPVEPFPVIETPSVLIPAKWTTGLTVVPVMVTWVVSAVTVCTPEVIGTTGVTGVLGVITEVLVLDNLKPLSAVPIHV